MLSVSRFILFAVLICAIPASFLGQQIPISENPAPVFRPFGVAISEYPAPLFQPLGIATGSDGNLWITSENSFKFGRATTFGSFTIFHVPDQSAWLEGIAAGPDGALWAADQSTDQIWRITTAGHAIGYPIPTSQSGAWGITAGPDGALWFTEAGANQIGRITTAGVVTEFPIPISSSNPRGITTGPDGALWFTQSSAIGRITTSGAITEFPMTSAPGVGITAGPDGALWFVVPSGTGVIVRMTTSGVISQYPLPNSGRYPFGITSGADGALWFTEDDLFGGQGAIGRITTSGAITEYPAALYSVPQLITSGPDGNVWFTDVVYRIGQSVTSSANLSVSPDTGVYQTPLEFTGSGFAAGENVLIYRYGIGSDVLASAVADSEGGFGASLRAPPSPDGPRVFLGLGQTSGKLGAAHFSENPRLILIPNAGDPGSSAVFNAAGFPPDADVTIFWDAPQTELGRATPFPDGSVVGKRAVQFTVPAGASPGVHRVFIKSDNGQRLNAAAYFTVE
jgi:virginiamycin B lyase